jgi:hypothetical protein
VKQETIKVLADGSSLLTVSTGTTSSVIAFGQWDWINANAAGIGVLATIIFGFIAIGFNIYNSFKLGKADKNEVVIDEHGEKLDAHIQDTVAEFANVNSGISEILSKLDEQG